MIESYVTKESPQKHLLLYEDKVAFCIMIKNLKEKFCIIALMIVIKDALNK